MGVSEILAYALGIISVASALLVVFSKNPIHSVLYLIITFFSIAGQYVLLNAQFLFIVQIIVYSGAIMVLFLFVLMLLNLNKDTEPQKSNLFKFISIITACSLFISMIAMVKGVGNLNLPSEPDSQIGLVKNLGLVLFSKYVIPFELSSVLFISGMVGAVMIGKKETHDIN
ncbi:MAG: NADH-quinone oxidoreductase subunit J [Bacteroidota bacterium]